MRFFQDLAYSVFLGPFPLIAVMGFATYITLLMAAVIGLGRRWSKRLRRLPPRAHRSMGLLTVVLGTIHLLMGVSLYL
jgi:hypothetical protein